MHGCQSGVIANAEPPAPEVLTNEGHEAVRGDHSRTSLRQAEGPDAPLHSELECRGKERQRNVILHREAGSHFLEMAEIAAESISIYHGAEQLTLFHEEVIPGTSNQYSFGLK